jgi:hypothetical protein
MDRPYDKYLSGRPFLFRIQTPRVVGLAFLRTVDPVEADTFRVLVVQDFEGVAVEDGDDLAGEISNGLGGAEQEQEIAETKEICASPPHE